MDVDDVAGLRDEDVGIAEDLLALRSGIEHEIGGLCRLAAERPPRPETATIAVAHGDMRIGREDAELEHRREAAAPAAGPARIRQEAVARKTHRHLGLIDLDRGVLEIGAVGAGTVRAVAMR